MLNSPRTTLESFGFDPKQRRVPRVPVSRRKMTPFS